MSLLRFNKNRRRYRYKAAASATSSSSHGEVHHGPETRTQLGPMTDHLQEVVSGEPVEYLGGGAGGGATILFRVRVESRWSISLE